MYWMRISESHFVYDFEFLSGIFTDIFVYMYVPNIQSEDYVELLF